MKFRLIKTQTFDAYMNMALDEVISKKVSNKEVSPTIRLYRWTPNAISIGYFQGLKNEVDEEECERQGVDIVRRRTGGGAVYHDYEGELTYSIIAPEESFEKDIVKSYEQICNILIKGLKKLGIEAKFNPINDIIVEDRKISGNAQRRSNGILLQHGTILFKVDVDKMFSLLKVSKEKMADKLIKSIKKRVTCVESITESTIEDLENAIEESFKESYETEIGNYSNEEIEEAKKLAEEKYKTKEWNEMR